MFKTQNKKGADMIKLAILYADDPASSARSGRNVYTVDAIAKVDGEIKEIKVKTDNKRWAASLAGKTFLAERGKNSVYTLKRDVTPGETTPETTSTDLHELLLAQACLQVASAQFVPLDPLKSSFDPTDVADRARDILDLARRLYSAMLNRKEWLEDDIAFSA